MREGFCEPFASFVGNGDWLLAVTWAGEGTAVGFWETGREGLKWAFFQQMIYEAVTVREVTNRKI